MMFRKMMLFCGMLLAILLISNACYAEGGFQKIYEVRHLSDNLSSDQAWKKSFNTMNGEMKLQFRKLAGESDEKRFHFTVKLGKEYVYKHHFPKVEGTYSLMAIKDTATSRIFFALQSNEHAYLYGYEDGKFEVYIDSQNYLNRYSGIPKIAVLKDGSLVLAFEPAYANRVTHNQRYSFSWDNYRKWFAYKDLGGGFGSVDVDGV